MTFVTRTCRRWCMRVSQPFLHKSCREAEREKIPDRAREPKSYSKVDRAVLDQAGLLLLPRADAALAAVLGLDLDVAGAVVNAGAALAAALAPSRPIRVLAVDRGVRTLRNE